MSVSTKLAQVSPERMVAVVAMTQAVDILRSMNVLTRMANTIDASDAKGTVYAIAIQGMQGDLEKQIKIMIANWPRKELEEIITNRDNILANPHMYP